MSIEAMKLALEALQAPQPTTIDDLGKCMQQQAIAVSALYDAIEQAEKQEPVILVSVTSGAKIKLLGPFHKLPGGEHLLYAAPQHLLINLKEYHCD